MHDIHQSSEFCSLEWAFGYMALGEKILSESGKGLERVGLKALWCKEIFVEGGYGGVVIKGC